MNLPKKLQIPKGKTVLVIDLPDQIKLDFPTMKNWSKDSPVLFFSRDSKTLKSHGKPVIDSARADQLSWIAYPKAGKLGTDLNRDKLQELTKPFGIEGVRLISIDETWSAMRFRPKR